MDFELGIDMIREGYKACREERCWQLYCSVYPLMSKESFKSYDEFTKLLTEGPVKESSKEEVLDKVQGILTNFRWKKEEI